MNAVSRDPAEALTVQLLEWLERRPRTYAETMDAWRTSCPRLSIWEDACIEGLVGHSGDGERRIVPSDKGRAYLRSRGTAALNPET